MANVGPEVTVRETARLIASDKVEGTPVRRSNGDEIGTIERVMIDKRSGKVAYAVMSFGGLLGIGEDYRALPWSALRYNEDLDAYDLNLTDEQLRASKRDWLLRYRPSRQRLGAPDPRLLSRDGSLARGSTRSSSSGGGLWSSIPRYLTCVKFIAGNGFKYLKPEVKKSSLLSFYK